MILRALCSQPTLSTFFWKDTPRFLKLDIYKCPKMKTQLTFRIFFVIESFAIFLPFIIMTMNGNNILFLICYDKR